MLDIVLSKTYAFFEILSEVYNGKIVETEAGQIELFSDGASAAAAAAASEYGVPILTVRWKYVLLHAGGF